MAAPPSTADIDWTALSPPAREALGRVAFRLTAGSTLDEIALIIEGERKDLRYLEPPRSGPITKAWVVRAMRQIRTELRPDVS